jgi:hypothetical protein
MFLKSAGVSHIRYWLFEDGEGIIYDEQGYAIGVDNQFMSNLKTFVVLAQEYEMQVYWVLLDANSVRRRADMVTRLVLRAPGHAAQFWRSVVAVVLDEIVKVAWAIDLCNEPEAIIAGSLGNGTGLGFEWHDIVPSLNTLADSIREANSGIALTVGSGFHDHCCHLAGNYRHLRLDAYDFHFHSHDGSIAPAECVSQDRPVIIGELGWPVPHEWESGPVPWRRSQDALTARTHEAIAQRMAAIFLWAVDYPDRQDSHSLIYRNEHGNALLAVRRLQYRGLVDAGDGSVSTLMMMCREDYRVP